MAKQPNGSRAGLAVLTLLLAACQVAVTPPDPKRTTKPTGASEAPTATRSAVASAQPSAAASGSPTALTTASPGATAAPVAAAPRVLLRPQAPSAVLRGTVAIDASYLVRAGAGSVLAGSGVAPVAAPGQGLTLTSGPNPLIANNGGSVIANNSGNIISDKGSGLISDKGSGLISDNGALLISDNGALLISDNGALVMSNGGAAYGLLQAAAAPAAAPAYGETLPAAGMNLRVVSLLDGQAVTLGVDADGKPVTDVFTNLTGAFEVYVPASVEGTLRIVAQAPGIADGRLRYALFTRPDPEQATPAALDEDTAAMTRYVLQGMTTRFLTILRVAREARATGGVADADLVPLFFPDAAEYVPAEVVAFMGTRLGQVIQAVAANPKIGPADEAAIAQILADQVYARGPDLATIMVDAAAYTETERPIAATDPARNFGPALQVMVGIVRELRLAVVAQAQGQTPEQVEANFAAKPYLAYANSRRPAGAAPYRVRRATDLADFIVEEYVPLVRGQAYGEYPELTNGTIQQLSKAVCRDLGMEAFRVDTLYAAAGAITLALIPAATGDETLAGMKVQIAAYKK